MHSPQPGREPGHEPGRPARRLTTADGVALLVGTVVGVGIFKLPSLVAQNSGSDTAFLLFWLAGAVVALIGGLCYAELATRDADAGGEYSFLRHAFGPSAAFLFAWARLAVIQTGSIALVGFIFGDYAQALLPLGSQGPTIYALVAVAVLTAVNMGGATLGARTQAVLTVFLAISVTVLAIAGLGMEGDPGAPAAGSTTTVAGLAMVFVLYTFGGWNEAAYVAGELKDVRRGMVRVFLIGIALVTLLYLAINVAYLRVLGLDRLAESSAAGADLATATLGGTAGLLVAGLVALATLTTMNAAIFTGSRATYALGRDYPRLPLIGQWGTAGMGRAPTGALLVQACISMILIIGGSLARDGLNAMVEYTAPVFWFFLLMVGISVFLRRRQSPPPLFAVPLYPLTPILFCAASAFMLYSSLAYTGRGALLGLAALALGVPLLAWAKRPAERGVTRPDIARSR